LFFIYIFFFQFVKTPGKNLQTTLAAAAADSIAEFRIHLVSFLLLLLLLFIYLFIF